MSCDSYDLHHHTSFVLPAAKELPGIDFEIRGMPAAFPAFENAGSDILAARHIYGSVPPKIEAKSRAHPFRTLYSCTRTL